MPTPRALNGMTLLTWATATAGQVPEMLREVATWMEAHPDVIVWHAVAEGGVEPRLYAYCSGPDGVVSEDPAPSVLDTIG